MPSRHRALLAFGDVLGALLSLHSRYRNVKFRASKVEIIHLTAPTPGAFAALDFDPQLSPNSSSLFYQSELSAHPFNSITETLL